MNLENINRRLRKVERNGRGIDVQLMATLTGLSSKTVRRYLDLSDHSEPSLNFMIAVCTEYGLSLDHIANSGGQLIETAVEKRWQLYTLWWTANLQEDQKEHLMTWSNTVWCKALDHSETNPSLRKEQKLPVRQFGNPNATDEVTRDEKNSKDETSSNVKKGRAKPQK